MKMYMSTPLKAANPKYHHIVLRKAVLNWDISAKLVLYLHNAYMPLHWKFDLHYVR